MSGSFSTNELLLRSDRIAFGKIPPEVPSNQERTIILPNTTGQYLYFGLSSMISTNATVGTLEAIYPSNAAVVFDVLNNRIGVNVSLPEYALDISTTTGVRITGGSLIASGTGLFSVPTSALFSTLPSYLFAPGTIPPNALLSTGSIAGLSVPTSALFSTLPTSLFSPQTIPLASLQSTGVLYASSFVGDGYYLSNIPLANINGQITGNFFQPNTIPLSSIASTGQIWIRSGSIFAPLMSTGQLQANTITTNSVSTVNLYAENFNAGTFSSEYISAIKVTASSIQALDMISSARLYGDGRYITSLTPAALNTVIPSDKFGYRLIAFDALNPYGDFLVEAGTAQFKQPTTVTIQGFFTVSSIKGDGSQLTNVVQVGSLTSTVVGLGTSGYISTSQLFSTVAGITFQSVSSIQLGDLTSTVRGLGSAGYASTSYVNASLSSFSTAFGPGGTNMTTINSTIQGLGSVGYISSSQLLSTVAGITFQAISSVQLGNLTSTVQGLGSAGYASTSYVEAAISSFSSAFGPGGTNMTTITSTIQGLGSSGYISSSQLVSSVGGVTSLIGVSISSFSTAFGPGGTNMTTITSTIQGLGSSGYISSPQLVSSVGGVTSLIGVSISSFSTAFGPGGTNMTTINSTIQGLGSVGYISTSQLLSTVGGLQTYISSFIDPAELASSLLSFISSGYLTTQLTSTVQGLGTAGYLSGPVIKIDTLYGNTATLSSLTLLNYRGYSPIIPVTEYQYTLFVSDTQLYIGDGGLLDPYGLPANYNAIITDTLLVSSIQGLGSSDYISTSQLVSTTTGILNQTGGNLPTALTSTSIGLGSLGYISSSQLLSTTAGLQAYISSFIDPTELASSVLFFISTGYLTTQLTSTVTGLGSSRYISSSQLVSSMTGLTNTDGSNFTSSTKGLGSSGYISSSQLLSTVGGLQAYISSFIDPTELASSVIGFISTGYLTTQLTSTVTGLGSSGYISSSQLVSTTTGILNQTGGNLPTALTSTTIGLGSLGYISSSQLLSTVGGLQAYISSFIDPTELASSVIGFISTGYLTTQLTSTVTGLGSSRYISSSQLVSSMTGVTNTDGSNFTSSTKGLGSSGYISSSQLLSTVGGLQVYISSFIDPTELASSVIGFISTGYLTTQLTSTVTGLGFSGYISTSQLVSSMTGVTTTDGSNFASTTKGLGTAGYVSSLQLLSTVGGLQAYISSFIDPTELASSVLSFISTGYLTTQLTSTVAGLGSANYISSPQLLSTSYGLYNQIQAAAASVTAGQLASTVSGLGTTGYISSLQLLSTTAGLQAYISTFIDPTELASSVLSFISTGYLATQLTSTVTGLGSANYVSTASLVSTTIGLQTFVSTSIQAIPYVYTGATLYFNYSVPVNSYRELGTQILTGSPQQTVTTPLAANTNNVFVAGFESDFAVPSFLPSGFWDVTVFSLASGTEVYMYASIYIKYNTTENLVATTSNAPQLVPQILTEFTTTVPVPYSTISSGGTVVVKLFANHPAPGTRTLSTLYQDSTYSHVQTTFGVILEQQVLTSTIQGLGSLGYISTSQLTSTLTGIVNTDGSNFTSTVKGLGSSGYISSLQLLSTTAGLQSYISSFIDPTELASSVLSFISTGYLTIQLTSTVTGLGSANYISSSQLLSSMTGVTNTDGSNFTSTTKGLGSSGYISSTQLLSTVGGLQAYISSFIDPTELASSVLSFISTGYLTIQLTSTVTGLGSANYISSAQLLSSMTGVTNTDGSNFRSTTIGLGSANYISSLQLLSTVGGLQTYISSFIDPTELASSVLSFISTGYLTTQLTSTVQGLGSAGYISTSALNSTLLGLGTYGYKSTIVSSFNTISVGMITTSTLLLFDSLNYNSANLVYAKSTFLYFNNYIVAGATQLQPQIFTF